MTWRRAVTMSSSGAKKCFPLRSACSKPNFHADSAHNDRPRTAMQNNRNFFITIILSVLILTLWQVFYMNPRIEAQREAARIEAEQNPASQKPATEAANSGAAQNGQASS